MGRHEGAQLTLAPHLASPHVRLCGLRDSRCDVFRDDRAVNPPHVRQTTSSDRSKHPQKQASAQPADQVHILDPQFSQGNASDCPTPPGRPSDNAR